MEHGMLKCQHCRDEKGDYLCRHDVVGTPRADQEIIGYSEVKRGLLRLVRDSFQRSKDPYFVANLSAALIGDFGMGKSAIAHFFINAINNNDYDLVLVNLEEDGVPAKELQHFDWQQMATYRGAAMRIDARTVADELQPGQVTDYITPFFRKIGDEFAISPKLTSVKEITNAILKKKGVTRLFIFIDEMEGLKETQYGLNFEEFFARFTNDLRTLINGEGAYDIKNCITIVLCTVPSVWEEFKRREDIAGGLLTREYSEPFVLQRFELAQSYRFVERVCRNWENSPFTGECIRTLHLAADGKPRLLTKLCKHVEGYLPAGDGRSASNYDLATLTATALNKAVGSLEQFTYAFDPTSYAHIFDYLEREYSSDHARLFRLLVTQYGEYADEDLAQALDLKVEKVREIIDGLSSEERPVLGLRLISKGHLFDYSGLATDKVPRMMIEQNFMKGDDIDFSQATGEVTIFGKLDYFKDILERLTTETLEGEKKIFVSFHKEDLALLWNLSDEQADSLGKGLRACALQRVEIRRRLSEAARNRVFPVASQADLPFLSKEQYYKLRNATNNLSAEDRNVHLVGGVLKLLKHKGFEIRERTSAQLFDFGVNPEQLRQLFPNFNDDSGIEGRVLVIDSAEAFKEDSLAENLRKCNFALLICTRNFGDDRVLLLPSGEEDEFGPFRPTIVKVIRSTRLETNLLILSQVTPSDIVTEIEYQPTLDRLCRELDLESFLQAWRDLGVQSGVCLKGWQMKHGASRDDARRTLSHLIQVTPSLPLSLEEAKGITRKELGFPPTALPTWNGIDDLVDLGFASQRGQQYDVVLSPTEKAVLKMVECFGIDPGSYTNIPEDIAEQVQDCFWNFTSSPKIDGLREYVELLQEKGLLIRRTEQSVKQEASNFRRLYSQAEKKDGYEGTIKKYCDTWSRARRRRGIDGINRNFVYLFKNYQDLLERAVTPKETQRLNYCASALFDAHEDLSELYQEGESRYRAVKKRLDETERHKCETQSESKIVVRNTEETLEIRRETDRIWQTINGAWDQMISLHQEGTMEVEGVIELSGEVKSKCGQLQRTYREMKDNFQGLRSLYEKAHKLAQNASQTPYRGQVKQELQDVSDLDPDKKILDLLKRYRVNGRDAGNSGIEGYRVQLKTLAQRFKEFLGNQDRLERLNELHQNVEQFIARVEEHIQSIDSLEILIEGVQHLENVPLFFRSQLEALRKEARELSSTVENSLAKFALRITETDPLQARLDDLQANLVEGQENRENFAESVRQINYELKTIFSPMSFHCLKAAYDKFLGDFQFQFQRRVQEIYRSETYQDAEDRFDSTNEFVGQAEQCLEEISDLDDWFDQLGRDFEVSKFEGTSAQDSAAGLERTIENLQKKLFQRFPKDLDKALELLKRTQEHDLASINEQLEEIKLQSERECTARIDEAHRVVARFEQSLSSLRTQIYQMLDEAATLRKEEGFAQSLVTTRQVVDRVIDHLEQIESSQSVRLQVTLLSKPEMGFPELVTAYQQRFAERFDEETGAELVRLLQEGKLHATFSI
jgi:hypothetical protein